jgi:outer membrane protein assembly factor BamB
MANPARILATAAAVAVLSACAASRAGVNAPLRPESASWPMYQHSPDRNAVFSDYSLTRDWVYDAKAKINSGMALVGNTLLFTTFGHKVVALDVRDGHRLWHASLANIAMSTPIVAGNTVYVGTGKDGVLLQSLRDSFTFRNIYLRLKYHAEKAGIMGVQAGDEVAAFDLHSGARRWTYRTDGEDMPSAVYDGGRLIFANGDHHAYALRADTGGELWRTSLGGLSTMASAVQAGNLVVVAVCGGPMNASAVALNPASGKIVWRSPYGWCDAAPAYGHGEVFASSLTPGSNRLQASTRVAALDAKTGKTLWVFHGRPNGLWSGVGSGEAVVAGTYANGVYYQSDPYQAEILAFNAATGKVLWRFDTSGPSKMSPVVENGRLYIGDIAGLFYTIDARNGQLLEIRAFKKPFSVAPPIIAGSKILVVNDSSVIAMPLSGQAPPETDAQWAMTTLGKQELGTPK